MQESAGISALWARVSGVEREVGADQGTGAQEEHRCEMSVALV